MWTVLVLVIFMLGANTQADSSAGPPVIINQSARYVIFKEGTTERLVCEFSGNSNTRVRWTKNYRIVSVDNEVFETKLRRWTVHVIANATERDEGVYQCFAENEFGTAASDRSKLTMARLEERREEKKNPIRRITRQLGAALVLRAPFFGSVPAPDVQWVIIDKNNATRPVELSERVAVGFEYDLHFANTVLEDESNFENVSYYACAVSNLYIPQQIFGFRYILKLDQGPRRRAGPPTPLSMPPRYQHVVEGDQLSLKCIFSGIPTPEVTWGSNGLPLEHNHRASISSFGQQLIINDVTHADEGSYWCRGDNAFGRTSIYTINVKVATKPRWSMKPTDKVKQVGDDATYVCDAVGIPKPTTRWYINGDPIESLPANPRRHVSGPSLTFTNLTLQDNQVIQCNATNYIDYFFTNAYLLVKDRTTLP